MAAREESPPCFLTQLPYELLKLILAELDPHDQISVSKTCIRLWQLAYPMAYNRITVTIGPQYKESEWQHLASGVGLRYVQHLEVNSLFGTGKKSKNTEDLIAGTLIAALRRNQLLSFGFAPLSLSTSAISVKTVVILLETQRRLNRMALPSISEPYSFNFDRFLRGDYVISALRHVTISVVGSKMADNAMRGILKRLVDVKELHFQFCPIEYEDELQLPLSLVRTPCKGRCLLSMATNITMREYRFGYRGSGLEAISIPLLRALALVNCDRAHYFFDQLRGSQYPYLSALMVTGGSYLPMSRIRSFLREVTCLRELILGPTVDISDATLLTNHTDTLELLSLVRQHCAMNLPIFQMSSEQIGATFSSFTTLRHLCLSSHKASWIYPHGRREIFDEALGIGLGSIVEQGTLRTLHLQVNTVLYRPSGLELPDVVCLQERDFFEDELASNVAHMFTRDGIPPVDDHSLEYVATTNFCSIQGGLFRGDRQQIVPIDSMPAKRMLSLKPTMLHKPVHQLKEEMMKRYAGDGYYLLEVYIDGMMKSGSLRC